MTLLPKKILLADDDNEDQEMLVEALQEASESSRIDRVSNGQEVLDYLSCCPKEDLPALMILDYKMPFLNAAEVLETIKEDNRYSSITKIVWSTSTQREHMDRCKQAGAQKYFVKPVAFNELRGIAENIVKMMNPDRM